MVLPETKKLVKLLNLHRGSGSSLFSGNFSGLNFSMKESFGKKNFTFQVPSINYDDRVWLEQFNSPYFASKLVTNGGTIEMEFSGFPFFFPTDRICQAVKSTLQYFSIHYALWCCFLPLSLPLFCAFCVLTLFKFEFAPFLKTKRCQSWVCFLS